MTQYEAAKKRYAERGVDADAAINTLKSVPVSLHCWQGDDVRGFDGDPNAPLTGGIQTTGNYPGRARTPEELMADIDEVLRLCPGTKKLNLHASYAIFTEENGGWVDRDKLEPKHFAPWVKFCKERGLGCDFNPTYFSHPKCDPLTLSSPNPETRKFWVEHDLVVRCRELCVRDGLQCFDIIELQFCQKRRDDGFAVLLRGIAGDEVIDASALHDALME